MCSFLSPNRKTNPLMPSGGKFRRSFHPHTEEGKATPQKPARVRIALGYGHLSLAVAIIADTFREKWAGWLGCLVYKSLVLAVIVGPILSTFDYVTHAYIARAKAEAETPAVAP